MKRLFVIMALLLTVPAEAGIRKVWVTDGSERVHQRDTAGTYNSCDSVGGITGTLRTINIRTDGRNRIGNYAPGRITLFGGRNEVIEFQLIIHGDASGATNVNVTFDSLYKSASPTFTIKNTSTDPFSFKGRYIEMFVEHYQNIVYRSSSTSNWWNEGRPYPNRQYLGEVPEQLVPFEADNYTERTFTDGQGGAPFRVTANRNQGVWVDVYIPRNAEDGDYVGTLKITEGGTLRYTFPVDLKVYDYTLPDTNSLRTHMWGQTGVLAYASKYPMWNGSDSLKYTYARLAWGMLYKHRQMLNYVQSTAVFSTRLDSLYNGKYFHSSRWDAPMQGSKPNYLMIGHFETPNDWPSIRKLDADIYMQGTLGGISGSTDNTLSISSVSLSGMTGTHPATTNDYYNGFLVINTSQAETTWVLDYDGTSKIVTTNDNIGSGGKGWANGNTIRVILPKDCNRSWLDFPNGNYYAQNDRGTWAISTSYEVNDVVYQPDGEDYFVCVAKHTSISSNQPGLNRSSSTYSGWKAKWMWIWEKNYTGFDYHPDTNTAKQNWWDGQDWYATWFNANNPGAIVVKYITEEGGIRGGCTDSSVFADMRRKMRWTKENPGVGRSIKVRLGGALVPVPHPQLTHRLWPFQNDTAAVGVLAIANGQSPNYERIRVDSLAVYKARYPNLKFELYGGTMPQGPSEMTDAQGVSRRATCWIMKKYGVHNYALDDVAGQVNFDTTSDGIPVGDTWINEYDGSVNGNTTHFFPGSQSGGNSRGLAGPVMGIRVKNLRRGIQDYEMLTMAEGLGISTTTIINSVVKRAWDKMSTSENPTRDTTVANATWKQRGWDYEAARLALAQALSGASPSLPPTGTFLVNGVSADTLEEGGGTVTFTWSSNNATSATITPGVGSVATTGTTTYGVGETTTFTLTLVGTTTVQYTVFVFVTPGPRANALNFSVEVAPPQEGDTLPLGGGIALVQWNTEYADSQRIYFHNSDSLLVSADSSLLIGVTPPRWNVFTLRMYDYLGYVEVQDSIYVRPYKYFVPWGR